MEMCYVLRTYLCPYHNIPTSIPIVFSHTDVKISFIMTSSHCSRLSMTSPQNLHSLRIHRVQSCSANVRWPMVQHKRLQVTARKTTRTMCTVPGIAASTYATSYTGELATLPLIKYKTLPCLYPPGSTVPCRQIQSENKNIQNALKRVKQTIPQPPSSPPPSKPRPGSGSNKRIADTSRPNKVFETKFGRMDMKMIEELYTKTRYTSFTQKAGAEFALPVQKMEPPTTTQELKPDMIRLHGQRYEQREEEWQDAVLWDRIQSRAPTNPRPISPGKDKILRRRHMSNTLDPARQDQIQEIVRTDGLANVFVRKCPGYAGYNPLCPPETRLDDKKGVHTLMSASYRQIPSHNDRQRGHARRGIFSKTVTLTYPFNPFNKVGQEFPVVDKELRYSSIKKHMGLCNENI